MAKIIHSNNILSFKEFEKKGDQSSLTVFTAYFASLLANELNSKLETILLARQSYKKSKYT